MKRMFLSTFLFFTFAFFATSCSFSTLTKSGQETATQNAFETAFAMITTQAYLNPSSTPTPPPTATFTATPTQEPTATLIPTATIIPTPSNTPLPPLAAKLVYASTFPGGNREFLPNEQFGIAFGFDNVGTVAWGPGTKLVFLGQIGDYVTVETEKTLDKVIAPGERYEFSLWAFGSEDMDLQTVSYQLYSENGAAIPGGYASISFKSY